MTSARYTMSDLLRIMQRLREPHGGCPWDLKQDFNSLVPSTLEECYELAQAIENGDYVHLAEELGDVLFQVIFYAQLGTEQGLFSFEEVVSTLAGKLLRRHPHVFEGGEIEGQVVESSSVEEVKRSWEEIKARERQSKQQHGILDDIPRALPALPRAQKVQKRAANVNFDWPDYAGARYKLQEELEELDQAVRAEDNDAIEDEMGDVLFSCVNACRHLGMDAEASLRRATTKFEDRFRQLVVLAADEGSTPDQLSARDLEILWERVKKAQSEST